MVEVFKTNVRTKRQAKAALQHIYKKVGYCAANFDLDDCDRILRVVVADPWLKTDELIAALAEINIGATVLPDEVPRHGPEVISQRQMDFVLVD